MRRRIHLSFALYWCFLPGLVSAQISTWRLGGDGLQWSAGDSIRIFIDFDSTPGAIQPIYLTSAQTVFSLLDNWSPWKFPRKIGYVDGQRPRAWKRSLGDSRTVHNATYLVDGDSTTYNPPSSDLRNFDWFTFDVAVPVPATRFGFFTPPRGFRSNGTPLVDDAVPAFEVSIATAPDPEWHGHNDYQRIGPVIAEVAENLSPIVQIDVPRQYIRFIRWHRNESVLDPSFVLQENSLSGQARPGSIGDFEFYARGIPQRVLYLSKIIDLGAEVNFGRLFWTATSMRMEDGAFVLAPAADVGLRVEVRTGRDDDPNIYREFDDKGREVEVSRQRYEYDLKEAQGYGYVASGRPGVRASVAYDEGNWTFWSPAFTTSGQSLNLRSGSHIQLKITLASADFDAFVRLDSLWIERAPLLARQIVGEVARLDDPQPRRGFTEVDLGQSTVFSYDIRADFTAAEPGFDALRIRTGGRVRFQALAMGDPLSPVEPRQVEIKDDEFIVELPARVDATNNAPIRIEFDTDVFVFAATFEGEAIDTAGASLPQPIRGGNATDEVSTNSLRVLGAESGSVAAIQDLRFSTPVLTPNGDGANDLLQIAYSLFRLPASVPIELRAYSLDGRQVARLSFPPQGSGPQQLSWDGRDAEGQVLPPGLYLVEVALQSDGIGAQRLRPLGIAY